jgi:hypothetical protein
MENRGKVVTPRKRSIISALTVTFYNIYNIYNMSMVDSLRIPFALKSCQHLGVLICLDRLVAMEWQAESRSHRVTTHDTWPESACFRAVLRSARSAPGKGSFNLGQRVSTWILIFCFEGRTRLSLFCSVLASTFVSFCSFCLQDLHGPVQTPWSSYEAKRLRML